jgi:hypothetical protein
VLIDEFEGALIEIPAVTLSVTTTLELAVAAKALVGVEKTEAAKIVVNKKTAETPTKERIPYQTFCVRIIL